MRKKSVPEHARTRVVMALLYLLFGCIVARLFYWQIIHRSVLQAEAENQYTRTIAQTARRGRILTSDGYVLVTNKKVFQLFAQPHILQDPPPQIAQQLSPILATSLAAQEASPPANLAEYEQDIHTQLLTKLSNSESKWVNLRPKIDEETKLKIESLKIHGIGFDPYEIRAYPEASLAAHVTGFVGKDEAGADKGYFGVEGELDRELRGQTEKKTFLKDALGFHLLFDQQNSTIAVDGRDVVLSIRRDIQHAVEEKLKEGMQRYGAAAGEVIVYDPKTGKILALASFPNYGQEKFYGYDQELYKNPAISALYEPGSTFKVLTVAAGIDAGVIKEDTQCTSCATARQIGQYLIRTWNEEYHPDITVADALAKSDNVAMVFVSDLLGQEKFISYLEKFGIGESTRVELEEDTTATMRDDWKPIDLATASFGQGIATTGLQMVRAVGAIANHGVMMRPSIVEKVIDPVRGKEISVPPMEERQVISKETAETVTRMMVHAAQSGEAKWTSSKTHTVAGKTGTAQIAIDGHYDEKKTIASFIGFAPADNPKFVMLVKLREPQTSQWASETAAPLWYGIASKLYLLMNIPPDR